MGWYGFNACSTLAISGLAGAAARVCVTTARSAASGCLATAALGCATKHEIDHSLVNNGVLEELAATASGCSVVNYWDAFCIGFIAAFVFVGSSKGMKLLGTDDVIDAVAVYDACGAWGVIAAAPFAAPYYYGMSYYAERKDQRTGIFYGGHHDSLRVAFACVGVIVAWTGSTTFVLFGALKYFNLPRVT